MTVMRRNLVGALAGVALTLVSVDPSAAVTKTFVGAPGASWFDTGSWAPSGVPQSADTVALSSGTVDLPSPTTITGLNMSGGTLSGSGQLVVTGAITWSGGELGSGGILEGQSGISLSGTLILNGRTLRITGGTATLSGAMSAVTMQNNAVFDNRATFAVLNDGGALNGTQGFGGVGAFLNRGTFQKTADSNTGVTRLAVPFDNAGAAQVSHGTLALAGGGTSTGGTFTATAPGTLDLSSASFDFDPGSAIGGSGAVAWRSNASVRGTYDITGSTAVGGGTIDFTGTVTHVGVLSVSAGTANFSSAQTIAPVSLSILGGLLTGSDAFDVATPMQWTSGGIAGSGAFAASAGIDLAGPAKSLDQRTIDLTGGTATLAGATSSIQMTNGAMVNVGAQATLDFSDDGGVSGGQGFSGSGALHNAGLVRKSAGTGVAFIEVPFSNTGALEVASGAVRLATDSSSDGTYGVSAGAVLELGGGAHDINAGASIAGAGTARFLGGITTVAGTYNLTGVTQVSGGVVSFVGSVNSVGALAISAGSANFSSATGNFTTTALDLSGGELTGSDTANINGLFTWTGGDLHGAGSPNAVANANAGLLLGVGNGPKRLNGRTLNLNGGAGIMDGASNTLQMLADAIVNNQAIFALINGGGGDQQGFFATGAASGTFNNHGLFRKLATGSSGTTRFDQVAFTNTGTAELLAGTLRCAAGYTQTMGLTRLSGGSIEVTPALDLQGGTLEGSGAVTGNLINGGEVQPGTSPGVLNVTGSYTQTAPGRLVIEIGGTAPAQFDHLNVSGAATLGGTLDIRLINAFIPALDDMFAFLTYASHTGSVAQIVGLDIGFGRAFSLVVDPTGAVLDVVPGAPTATATASTSPPATSTPTVSRTATATNTAAPSATLSATATQIVTATATAAATATATPSPSASATRTATASATHSPTATAPSSPTDTPSTAPSHTPTSTLAMSATATPTTPTDTPSASPTTTAPPSPSSSPTHTPTVPSTTPTETPIAAPTSTATAPSSPTGTATFTAPASATATDTVAPSATATATVAATATATRTAPEALTATATPRATGTATPTAGPVDATIIVGNTNGAPGQTFEFNVTLQTAVHVAGTINDIFLQAPLHIPTGDSGSPRCAVNADINKDGTTFTLNCTDQGICTLHATVLSIDNMNPIPNGARLYTCEVAIDADAIIVQAYPLVCANPQSSDASGNRLSTGCVNGTVNIYQPLVPTPTHTPLPLSATPTAAVTANPSDTATVPPAAPTATGTAPFIVTKTGCQVAASDTGPAWLLVVPPFLLARRRKGRR